MAVHAHPDDEAISTGGVLALAHDQGIRTVVVTCTNGEQGDGPGGVKPGEDGHDEAAVVAVRHRELEASAQILGVDHLELLGYHDSGMMGWPANELPDAFWNTPVEVAAARLVELLQRYQPRVVVTYDENGSYGHPDHIQTHRVTMAAVAALEQRGASPAKLYYGAIPRAGFEQMRERLRAAGLEVPERPDRDRFGTPDELITTRVDVSSAVARKWRSLLAHASQTDNTFFLNMGEAFFGEVFSTEWFVRVSDQTGSPLPETDLFAGLR
jgi:LmbE family N-acetylglucosaminyl deacetylase